MSRGRVALSAGLLLAVTGCGPEEVASTTPAPAAPTPETAAQLGDLVLDEVPSGLPRIRDADLQPPAGAKTVEDVASYADDPARERTVLRDYGYRQGWERFWGSTTGPLTSVFLDQFDDPAGAVTYARDLAGNDAEAYGGVLRHDPGDLPDGCSLLTVPEAGADTGLTGPAAFAWCGHGTFSVAATVVAEDVEAATAGVRAVVLAQLEELPPA
ncbi:MAG TPA: hypothetical protein VJ352_06780 [Geodermatophilus sp.]|nr:hypothetical protein [Geodermatophilus sp.]